MTPEERARACFSEPEAYVEVLVPRITRAIEDAVGDAVVKVLDANEIELLAARERIAALEAGLREIAFYVPTLSSANPTPPDADGIFVLKHKAADALSGNPQALDAALEKARTDGAREALLEAMSHEERAGPRDHNEMVVSVESIRAIEAALEDVEDVR